MSILLTALLLLSPPVQGQGSSASVTFSAPASTARSLFPELSKALGRKLETSPQTEGEVLLIRVKDVPASELMDQIATVANAEWRPEGSGFRLVRPTLLNRRIEAKELADRVAELADQLETTLKRNRELPAWNATEAQKTAKESQDSLQNVKIVGGGGISMRSFTPFSGANTPPARAIPTLLADIGAQKLGSIARNTRVVFALQPTSMQRPLGARSPRILREFVEQQRQYSDAFSRGAKPIELGANGNRSTIMIGGPQPSAAPGNPALGIGQAILIVNRRENTFNTELVVADTNGATLASGEYTLNPEPRLPKSLSGKHPIILSPLASELAKKTGNGGGFGIGGQVVQMAVVMTSSGSEGGSDPIEFSFNSNDANKMGSQISKELREKILHPETYDPESFAPGEAFTSASDSLGTNLVADLPDSSYNSLTARVSSNKIGAEDLIESVAPQAGIDTKITGSWLLATPHFPATAILDRVNRLALGSLVRKLDTQRFLRLDDLADFTIHQVKPTAENDIDGLYLKVINQAAASKAFAYLDDPWTLRIYATLTPNERSAAASNRAISLSELTTEQRGWLNYDIFNSFDGPNIQSSRGARRVLAVSALQMGPSVMTERTQILPDGLPRDGRLTFQVKNDQAVLGIESRTGNSSVVTASKLASQIYQSERPELSAFGSGPKFDLFRPANETTYRFQYQLITRVSFERSLSDAFIDLDTKAVAFAGLPDPFRSKVEKQVANMRNSIGKFSFGDGGGTPPP